MHIEAIACNSCTKILGRAEVIDMPSVAPSEVYNSEDEEVERDFADGWLLTVFPDPSDPVALCQWHQCPDCR